MNVEKRAAILNIFIKGAILIVNIVDNLMGKGKSSAALQYINDNRDKRYLYVTPYLSECQRV